MDTLLFIFAPGGLFAYFFFAIGENLLTYGFDEKYFRFGRGKTFLLNSEKLSILPKNTRKEMPDGMLYLRLPIQFIFYRLLVNGEQAELKTPYFHWLAQPFVVGTALIFYLKGHEPEALKLFLGGEFLLGGFHLQCHLKAQQWIRELRG